MRSLDDRISWECPNCKNIDHATIRRAEHGPMYCTFCKELISIRFDIRINNIKIKKVF